MGLGKISHFRVSEHYLLKLVPSPFLKRPTISFEKMNGAIRSMSDNLNGLRVSIDREEDVLRLRNTIEQLEAEFMKFYEGLWFMK